MQNTMHLLSLLSLALIINYTKSDECDTAHPKSVEAGLRKAVLCNYDKSSRPVLSSKNVTSVQVGMLLKTMEYSQYDSRIAINSWFLLSWKDEHLNWKPSQHEHIDSFKIASSKLWVPDIIVYNGRRASDATPKFNTACEVHYTGRVSCVPQITHSAMCSADTTRWPFDVQNCTYIFGSVAYNGSEIDYKISPGDDTVYLKEYEPNREWNIRQINVSRHSDKSSWKSLQISFILERHSSTHVAQILIPILVLVLLNLVAIWIHTHSRERVVLLCINLSCHCEHMYVMAWFAPTNAETCPLVVLFLRDSLFITSTILLITVYSRRLRAYTSEPPGWIISASTYLLSSKAGQLLLLNESDPKVIAPEVGSDADDDASLVAKNPTGPLRPREWNLSAILLDRVTCYVVFLAYVIMLLTLLPRS